jgi:hypothetical protein
LWKYVVLFIVSFFTAVWHEVWLVLFAFIILFLLAQAVLWKEQKDNNSAQRDWIIFFIVSVAYLLAIRYYVNGESQKFLALRTQQTGNVTSFLTAGNLIKTIVGGTKENLVLLKDFIPVFLILLYIKLDKKFRNLLESDFFLFVAAAAGSIVFMYVVYMFVGPIHWRARWQCGFIWTIVFLALPIRFIFTFFNSVHLNKHIELIRRLCLIVALVWFAHTAYRTFWYTNIDVRGWLQYRDRVVKKDPDVLNGLCCRTLPEGRPRGVAPPNSHVWGVQDDRYRFFMGVTDQNIVNQLITLYWAKLK